VLGRALQKKFISGFLCFANFDKIRFSKFKREWRNRASVIAKRLNWWSSIEIFMAKNGHFKAFKEAKKLIIFIS
jgi:hypothetical protein